METGPKVNLQCGSFIGKNGAEGEAWSKASGHSGIKFGERSVILSKAMLKAADDEITDQAILAQLK
jgi:hypothetical protein